MTESPFKHCENKKEYVADIWECRYFVSVPQPPPGFDNDSLRKETKFFEKWDGPRDENDVYFVGADPTLNVKLRKPDDSRASIKLRVRHRREPDGFELWHTEFVETLPAPAEAWSKVLAMLNVQCDPNELSSCSEPNEIEALLAKGNRNLLCRETRKKRWRYSGPEGYVEVARVTIDSVEDPYQSVSFESSAPDPARIRAVRDELWSDKLGEPTNYVELLLKISAK